LKTWKEKDGFGIFLREFQSGL